MLPSSAADTGEIFRQLSETTIEACMLGCFVGDTDFTKPDVPPLEDATCDSNTKKYLINLLQRYERKLFLPNSNALSAPKPKTGKTHVRSATAGSGALPEMRTSPGSVLFEGWAWVGERRSYESRHMQGLGGPGNNWVRRWVTFRQGGFVALDVAPEKKGVAKKSAPGADYTQLDNPDDEDPVDVPAVPIVGLEVASPPVVVRASSDSRSVDVARANADNPNFVQSFARKMTALAQHGPPTDPLLQVTYVARCGDPHARYHWTKMGKSRSDPAAGLYDQRDLYSLGARPMSSPTASPPITDESPPGFTATKSQTLRVPSAESTGLLRGASADSARSGKSFISLRSETHLKEGPVHYLRLYVASGSGRGHCLLMHCKEATQQLYDAVLPDLQRSCWPSVWARKVECGYSVDWLLGELFHTEMTMHLTLLERLVASGLMGPVLGPSISGRHMSGMLGMLVVPPPEQAKEALSARRDLASYTVPVQWKEFFCVLIDSLLIVYESAKSPLPCLLVPLAFTEVTVDESALKRQQFTFSIGSHLFVHHFRARHEVSMAEWLHAIDEAALSGGIPPYRTAHSNPSDEKAVTVLTAQEVNPNDSDSETKEVDPKEQLHRMETAATIADDTGPGVQRRLTARSLNSVSQSRMQSSFYPFEYHSSATVLQLIKLLQSDMDSMAPVLHNPSAVFGLVQFIGSFQAQETARREHSPDTSPKSLDERQLVKASNLVYFWRDVETYHKLPRWQRRANAELLLKKYFRRDSSHSIVDTAEETKNAGSAPASGAGVDVLQVQLHLNILDIPITAPDPLELTGLDHTLEPDEENFHLRAKAHAALDLFAHAQDSAVAWLQANLWPVFQLSDEYRSLVGSRPNVEDDDKEIPTIDGDMSGTFALMTAEIRVSAAHAVKFILVEPDGLSDYSKWAIFRLPTDEDTVVTIGRAVPNSVIVADKHVSRQHARLEWNAEHSTCEFIDVGSSFGSKVNGTTGLRCFIGVGDIITVGNSHILVRSMAWTPAPSHAESEFEEEPELVALGLADFETSQQCMSPEQLARFTDSTIIPVVTENVAPPEAEQVDQCCVIL